jgi:hypothetical protein
LPDAPVSVFALLPLDFATAIYLLRILTLT